MGRFPRAHHRGRAPRTGGHGRLTRSGRIGFLALTLLLLAGLALSTTDVTSGVHVAGAALVGYALWLAHFDIVRHTIRRPGLPRFVALALLAGYVWLGVGGVLWLRDGRPSQASHTTPSCMRSSSVSSSMIFGHAPVIFPGVLGLAIPFRRPFYLHLALLHVGLTLRVGGDLAGNFDAARWGGMLNAAAISLFLLATLASAALARLTRPARVPTASLQRAAELSR